MTEESKIAWEPTEEHPRRAKILKTELVTHDVKRFAVEKPAGFAFVPGQANLIAPEKPGWEKRSEIYCFTSLNSDPALEFIIKIYPEHNSVSKKLHSLGTGDGLVLHEPFGTIRYKGKGVFLAAGTGITPFIAILRQLHRDKQASGNTLIFSNKKAEDVILEEELREIFGNNLILTLSREQLDGYENGRINKAMIQKHTKDFNQYFYVCGPDPFVLDLRKTLRELGVKDENIVAERLVVGDA